MYKFFVFCPQDNTIISAIINAAAQAGAGEVGLYTHCAFVTTGYGTWFPLPGSSPTIGKVGELSTEKEVKIEMECPKARFEAVCTAIRKVHPYDHIAIDAVSLERYEPLS